MQQLEESLRDLASEARKRHPGVKEASERATLTLRQYKNAYASAVRQANASSAATPTTKVFQSSELLHPFLLAANYPNASPKLLEITFKAMRLLLEADAVVPHDCIHLVRVWMIQAQVVATHFQKHNKSKNIQNEAVPALIEDPEGGGEGQDTSPDDTKSLAKRNDTATSSSSWFFWSSSSTSTTDNTSAPSTSTSNESSTATTSSMISSMADQPPPSNVVSSSTGQSGHASNASSKEMEKLALDILSSLSLLMQMMHRNYPEQLVNDAVLWKHNFSVICLCLSPFMSNTRANGSSGGGNSHSGNIRSKKKGFNKKASSSVIQQAAHSTLSQMLTLLYEPIPDRLDDQGQQLESNPTFVQLREATWQDLLRLCQASTAKSVASLQGAFALCKTTAGAGPASSAKKGTPPPVPVPPSPTLALQVLTKMWRNSQYKITSDHVAIETLQMTLALVKSIQSNNMTSVEAPHAIFQWSQLAIAKLGEDYSSDSYKVVYALLKLVAMASESCRRHPDFEDGFVYSLEYASSVGKGDLATATSRSSMTQTQQAHQQSQDSGKNNPSETLPLISARTLGKANMALDSLFRVLADEHVAGLIIKDPSTVGYATETMSDFATLAASSKPHMIQLVNYVTSIAGAEGQYEQKGHDQLDSFVRKLEEDIDSDWDNLIDHATLGEAVWLSLSCVLRILECVSNLNVAGKVQVAELFAPSLAVLQHYLKRFCGSAALVRMSLDGYESLAKLCFPSVDMQKALLTSLCRLSLPSWGKRDHTSLLEDHHIEALLSVIRIMHMYHENIDTDWEVILMTLEDLSALSIASPNLTDVAYHSALAISSVYGRIAAFSTSFSDSSLIKMVDALCHVVEEFVQEKNFLSEASKNSPSVPTEATSERHGSFGERLMKAGVTAIYGNQSNEAGSNDGPAVSARTKTRFYEEYRRDFVSRTSKTIRTDGIGRVPFSLAVIADVSMANAFRYNDCGERLSGLLSKLAVAAPLVRPFLMDTIAIMTKIQMSETSGSSPAPFIGPGRIVFENPMQSQLLAVEYIELPRKIDAPSKDDSVVKSQLEGKGDENPQSALLVPLCDSLRTASKPDIAESSLETLHSVVETTGHNFSEPSWNLVISALLTLSGDVTVGEARATAEWSKCSLDAFGCLKFIANDFIDELPAGSDALKSLLDCCSHFGNSRHDVNTSLTAIGLLWRIAEQDSGPDAVDRALSKLVLLANDSRPEVRNASVNTLFSCIVGRGATFTPEFWKTCMHGIVFKVYDKAFARARGEEIPSPLDAPTDNKKSRYQVPVHHSRDSETKQWVATQIVVLRGLIRVLRSFFSKLLETTGSVEIQDPTRASDGDDDNVPWFQDAWVQILDYAYDAAAQGGDRETLDIRNVGVELLVLCCQLSSKGGLKALSPARVGTNMEVVDGALRTVRNARSKDVENSGSIQSSSSIYEISRENFFLEAFESLESYVEFLGNLEVHGLEMDDSQLQVIQMFSYNLKSLYDGGKDVDLKKDNKARCLECFEGGSLYSQRQQSILEDDLEGRLVKLLATVLKICTVDLDARFLNQAQRSCLTLLKAMACDGSCDALRLLANLGSIFFFIRKDGDDLELEKSESVGLEAISSLTEAMRAPIPADECKCLILNEVLGSLVFESKEGLLAERQNRQFKMDYKRLVPIIEHGLDSSEALRVVCGDSQDSLSYRVSLRSFALLQDVISLMAIPLSMGNGMSKVSRVLEVKDILRIAVPKFPSEFAAPVSDILIQFADTCLEVAELHETCSIKHDDKSVASKSKQHRDELLQLFSECFFGCCILDPKHTGLQSSCASWLHHAVTVMTSSPNDGETYIIEAVTLICQTVRKVNGAEAIIPRIFPYLCQLIGTEDDSLRSETIATLTSEKAQNILKASDLRAREAENHAASMTQQLNELQQENNRLRQTIAVLEAGPSL